MYVGDIDTSSKGRCVAAEARRDHQGEEVVSQVLDLLRCSAVSARLLAVDFHARIVVERADEDSESVKNLKRCLQRRDGLVVMVRVASGAQLATKSEGEDRKRCRPLGNAHRHDGFPFVIVDLRARQVAVCQRLPYG